MVFVACGLNHKTAPIELREQVAIAAEFQPIVLQRLMRLATVHEVAILSTCNRTEIYCETEAPDLLIHWFAEEYRLSIQTLEPHFYLHQGDEGIRHTLRVASGLDSMMLGEPQILGQMKLSFQTACEAESIKARLRQVFEYIFSATKRIRNQSGIAKNPVSIAYASVQLVAQCFKNLQAIRVLLIGSGETAALVAKYLQKEGVNQFTIASRCLENAAKLARQFNGKTVSITAIAQQLVYTDVVITATSCPLPFIDKAMVKEALKFRQSSPLLASSSVSLNIIGELPLFLLDLAVPRDIEAEVGDLKDVRLYNIDDLQSCIDKGMEQRQLAAIKAEEMVSRELASYQRWHRSLAAKELICAYRAEMQRLSHYEMKKALTKLVAGLKQEEVLEEFCQKLVKKLTHVPMIGLKKMALDNRLDLLDFSRSLFNAAKKERTHEEIA